jgi:hypothetical protein
MNLLVALPLLPLAVAAWLALSRRGPELATGWTVALVAALPLSVAALVAPQEMAFPDLLVQGSSALVLDGGARAGLLLFGGSWFAAGLLMTRGMAGGPSVTAMLVALSGAITLALASGGPLVYAGMLAVGYGLYGVMASEGLGGTGRPGRALIVLLVLSDLMVFEVLLSNTAHPASPIGGGLALLAAVALLLRSGAPPAHGWLPPALVAVSVPTAVLVASVPMGAAWLGGFKLMPGGAPGIAPVCLALGLAGALWATAAGLAQTRPAATVGYAAAGGSALLLLAFPAGAGSGAQYAWLALSLSAACAVPPLLGLQPAGWVRDLGTAALLLVHGLAAGQLAVHAGGPLSPFIALLPALAAVLASLLLTLSVRRVGAPGPGAQQTTRLAFVPLLLAAVGLGFAWRAELPGFAAAWTAPVGITLGLLAHRFLPAPPAVPPGDLMLGVAAGLRSTGAWLASLCTGRLAALRDASLAGLLGLWDGPAWSRRVQQLDIRLRSWPATSVMMLLVALGAAWLLAQ